MKCQFFSVEAEKVEEVSRICEPGKYRVLNQALIPSVIPEGLRGKCREAVVVASTCDTGVVICINLQRVDTRSKAIDQMPFALISVPNMAASSCLLHHADYDGRTTYPDETFWKMVDASGIEQYVQIPDSPPNRQGSLSELKGSSHEKGFLKAKAEITTHNRRIDGNVG